MVLLRLSRFISALDPVKNICLISYNTLIGDKLLQNDIMVFNTDNEHFFNLEKITLVALTTQTVLFALFLSIFAYDEYLSYCTNDIQVATATESLIGNDNCVVITISNLPEGIANFLD